MESSLDQFLLVTERQLLFHGGAIPGIRTFRPAVNETFGHGLYLTSNRKRAESYATFRTKTEYDGSFDLKDIPLGGFQATCYVFETDRHSFLDLRKEEAMKAAIPFWREYIAENREVITERARRCLNTKYRNIMATPLCDITDDIKYILQWDARYFESMAVFPKSQSYLNKVFSEWLQSNRYDGVIAFEGNDRCKHDKLKTRGGNSWVVFDPTTLRFVEEYRVVGELQ